MNLASLSFERQPGNQAYFGDLKQVLIAHIYEAEYIYGCVAWLTHVDILRALKQRKCSVIVNQENWSTPFRSKNLRDYAELTPVPFEYLKTIDPRVTPIDPNYVSPAIRSIGKPSDGDTKHTVVSGAPARFDAVNLMHHKFLILESSAPDGIRGVWTGSFNFTHNATNSLENAIFCTDEHVVHEYKKEFMRMYRNSGELKDNWEPGMYYRLGSPSSIPSLVLPPPPLTLALPPSPEPDPSPPRYESDHSPPRYESEPESDEEHDQIATTDDDVVSTQTYYTPAYDEHVPEAYDEHVPEAYPRVNPRFNIPACGFCGRRNHSESYCFKNPRRRTEFPPCPRCNRTNHEEEACFYKR